VILLTDVCRTLYQEIIRGEYLQCVMVHNVILIILYRRIVLRKPRLKLLTTVGPTRIFAIRYCILYFTVDRPISNNLVSGIQLDPVDEC